MLIKNKYSICILYLIKLRNKELFYDFENNEVIILVWVLLNLLKFERIF